MKVITLVVLCVFTLDVVYAPLPRHSRGIPPDEHQRTALIKAYFRQGYPYKDIVLFLATIHGINIGIDRLKQILFKLKLRRHNKVNEDNVRRVLEAVRSELEESGQCLGYRAMWKRLTGKGVEATRDVVRMAIKLLKPHLVRDRQIRRLHRRSYANPGPNFCWHVDGYDKLKPFGFAIHGAIDGFSRKIMWLKVAPTNNNPQVIALYYVQALLEHGAVPCMLRTDRGTENVHLEKIQKYLRRNGNDMLAAANSFLYGRSTANQRIESWWAILRRQCMTYWINLFKDMATVGLINVEDAVHMNCLRFCFAGLILKDLNRIAKEWNSHMIQSREKQFNIPEIPNKMYSLPGEYGSASFAAEFHEHDIKAIEVELELDNGHSEMYNSDFVKIVNTLIPDWNSPTSVLEAQDLYVDILRKIRVYEDAN